MRNNLPITHHEYILQDTETVVSKTDLHGKITYINRDFVKISGFSEFELMGSPQNIVRHPDMPQEAFDDLWRTIKSGKAWTGLVKNRCKNGDHYWVEANVAPIFEQHQIVGFTSIRIKPSRAQVTAAAAAYAALKAGDRSISLHEGAVVRHNWLHRFNLFKHSTIQTRVICSIAPPDAAIWPNASGQPGMDTSAGNKRGAVGHGLRHAYREKSGSAPANCAAPD
jgi:aerotaxis receptor